MGYSAEELAEQVEGVSTALAGVKEPVTATELAKCFARANKVTDMGEILEMLCAMGKAWHGKVERTFLPWCINSKPLEVNELAARTHKKRKRRPNSFPFCVFCASSRQDLQSAFELWISLPD